MTGRALGSTSTHYGYFVVLGVIAAVCTMLYIRFRKARWL